jgi:Predicted membrane protein
MGLMHIIWMIIVGFVVGLVARWLYPGAVALGFWATCIIGIVGSLIGGVIGGLVWRSPDGKFHPAGFILSVVGALLVLWLYLTYVAH